MSAYLVYFLTDEVDDAMAGRVADRLRVLASGRSWASELPGFIDSAEDGEGAERTTGGYLRLDGDYGPEDVLSFWHEIVAVSHELQVSVEVQWREQVVGRVHCGEPEEGVIEAVLAIA